jgi:hypothetical protein
MSLGGTIGLGPDGRGYDIGGWERVEEMASRGGRDQTKLARTRRHQNAMLGCGEEDAVELVESEVLQQLQGRYSVRTGAVRSGKQMEKLQGIIVRGTWSVWRERSTRRQSVKG